MELITFLVADYANIAMGDKINVMGIFRNIYAAAFPARHSTLHLVIKLGAELGEYGQERLMTIKLHNPDGKELLSYPINIKIPPIKDGQRPEVNAIIEMKDIIFENPGRYRFVLLLDKDFKGSVDIDVSLSNQPKKG